MVQATQLDHLNSAKGHLLQDEGDVKKKREEQEPKEKDSRSSDKLKLYIQQLVSFLML